MKVGLVVELTSGKIIFLIGLAKWIKDGAKASEVGFWC